MSANEPFRRLGSRVAAPPAIRTTWRSPSWMVQIVHNAVVQVWNGSPPRDEFVWLESTVRELARSSEGPLVLIGVARDKSVAASPAHDAMVALAESEASRIVALRWLVSGEGLWRQACAASLALRYRTLPIAGLQCAAVADDAAVSACASLVQVEGGDALDPRVLARSLDPDPPPVARLT